MSEEDLVLAAFLTLAVALVAATVRFFRSGAHRGGGALRLLAGNGLVLLSLGALLLLGGECLHRFARDTTDSFGLSLSTARWFRRHYQRNNLGFRDSVDYAPAVAPGRRRLTLLGDSFTAGHGVADVEARFANRLRRPPHGYEVHALAQNGWDTGDELRLLEGRLSSGPLAGYAVQDVVLVYCLNDLSDLLPEWQAALQRIYHRPPPPYPFLHSYLLNTLYYRWLAATDPDVGDYFRVARAGYAGPAWPRQRERLRAIARWVRGRGGRLLVVTFPFLHALGPAYPYAAVHGQLDALWREEGVPHLDLLDTFRGAAPGDVVVSRLDAHPNERAHAMAAGAIAAFLAAQGEGR